MNNILLKQMALLSLIFGAALGVISVIPIIGTLAFMTLMFLSATFVILKLKKSDFLGKLTTRDGTLYGALVGFVACWGFCATMVPLASLISFINHMFFHKLLWYSSISIWFTNGIGGIFVLVMIIMFVALLSALMNSFGGLVTTYFGDQILNKEESDTTFHIDS